MKKFLNYIKKNYRVLEEEQLRILIFRFHLEFDEAVSGMKKAGWHEDTLQGGQKRYWHPDVKDKNSMINMTVFKELNKTSDDYIDVERE